MVLEVSVFSVSFTVTTSVPSSLTLICAKNQLIVNPSQWNAYNLFPERTVFFLLDVKNFPDQFQTLTGIQISSVSGCGRLTL